MNKQDVVYLNTDQFKEYYSELFKSVSIPKEQADIISESLVFANLRGVDSHGVTRMGIYMQRLKKKIVESITKVKITSVA